MKSSKLLSSAMLIVLAASFLLASISNRGISEEPKILNRTIIFTLPYIANFNPWAPGNTLGLAWLGVQPLFYFLPNNQIYIPALAKRATFNAEEMYAEIELWEDNYWVYRGELIRPVDARDVWTFYTIQWKIMRSWVPQLENIEIVGKFKVRFYFSKTYRSYVVESPYVDNPERKETYNYTSIFQYYSVYAIFGWLLPVTS
ncbi:MAG: hypothetical protein QXV75_08240, partial [Candidatus Bathyarchaeia archaeon]